MPPKPEITIVKFRRARSTYVTPLLLKQKKNLRIEYFINSLVQAINSSGGLRVVDIGDDSAIGEDGIQVTAEDIELAYPKTKELPYANDWIPFSDDQAVETIILNDYDTLGFKYVDDADFTIEQPVYEEDGV